ncbi:MAG: exodeoxyribonuclease III [Candidatus Pelagibacter sp. TMED64]|nr:exodeoxyribonuclease III [Candidatus Pelagibacter sp.]OUU66081.1 MAG: exodeoxyribonuclease III [Candidatus Pelagibacter sp. TMED64]
MKISTWNVNSVRARIDNVLEYIKLNKPDILLLQEIKTINETFPYEAFKKAGYISYVNGQKSYNGVAILSKTKLKNIETTLRGDKIKQARIIACDFEYKKKNIKIINIYLPNGNPIDTDKFFYKMNWIKLLINKLKLEIKKNKLVLVGGDFNIIPKEIDVYNYKNFINDAVFRIDVRNKFDEIIKIGFVDSLRIFNKKEKSYTYWDYMSGAWPKNNGLRIDHFLASNDLISLIKNVEIKKSIRNQIKPSDHVPLECFFI